ncbi:uncharacterized protein KY384_006724 [Bacidia gigantensis]|uniref:uncharacterized protein n=1 Tax=Bacidia gigantensis TaxID=2732470 RepID=UPI001D055A92|nr:uncharacterized protein KY384_006724 [Bacidia gigantensis]KAG8528552.1 hypothetical protein KY384_006724 [Bacidia gigantensis]
MQTWEHAFLCTCVFYALGVEAVLPATPATDTLFGLNIINDTHILPLAFDHDGFHFSGEVDTSVETYNWDEGDYETTGECMNIFSGIVTDHEDLAQVVPVDFKKTGFQTYIKMTIDVIEQGVPPLTWGELRHLLDTNWPLYYMPVYDEHPFWFNVTNDAGVFLRLTFDRMPVTNADITAGDVGVHAKLYHENALNPADVQSVLDQAIAAWSHQLDVRVSEDVVLTFTSNDVTMLIQGEHNGEPRGWNYGKFSDGLRELSKYYRDTGEYCSFWSWIGYQDQSQAGGVTTLDIWG